MIFLVDMVVRRGCSLEGSREGVVYLFDGSAGIFFTVPRDSPSRQRSLEEVSAKAFSTFFFTVGRGFSSRVRLRWRNVTL